MPGDPPPAGTGRACRDPRVTVAVITHNRRAELARTLGRLAGLPEKPAIVVVDNGSDDGSAAYVRRSHPEVLLIAARRNLGAVGRNLALRHVMTPYVASATTTPGGSRARWPGPRTRSTRTRTSRRSRPGSWSSHRARIDPIVPELAHSPGPRRPGCPARADEHHGGRVRPPAETFRAAGGFSARLWLGGEEELLCTDLVTACCSAVLPARRTASPSGFPGPRPVAAPPGAVSGTRSGSPGSGARPRSAWRRTAELAGRRAPRRDVGGGVRGGSARSALGAAGTPAVPPEVEAQIRLLEEPRRSSPARRYAG